MLYGPVFSQEGMLVALLSNIGLRRAVQLVPRNRWLAALAGTESGDPRGSA
jgi:hypothetical protein